MAHGGDTSTSGLRIVRELGAQFSALERGSGRPLLDQRLFRLLALALLGAVGIAVTAAAATGVLSVGSVIPGGEDPGFRHDGQSPEQTVLATGRAPVAGPWLLTTYRSEGIVDGDGELAEPKGLPCVRILLTDPPATNPINGSAFCLAPGKANFNASSVPVVDESSGRAEIVIYGFAPQSATDVRLTAGDGKTIVTETDSGGQDFPGKVWVIAAPPGVDAGRLEWVNESGDVGDGKLDASRHFDSLVAPAG